MSKSTRRSGATVAAVVMLAASLNACSSDKNTVTVLAAASLTDTFTEIAEDFEQDHPGVDVRLAFDSSATLAEQAAGGAPADVLATADTRTMDAASEALAADPEVFAQNTMVLVVPTKPGRSVVRSFADLDDPGVRWVACVPTAPCGANADALAGSLRSDPASREIDVKATLARVTGGDADAGFVYRTDAQAAGSSVRSIAIPGSADHPSDYVIAPLKQSKHTKLADQFVAAVTGPGGQAVLTRAGFAEPEASR